MLQKSSSSSAFSTSTPPSRPPMFLLTVGLAHPGGNLGGLRAGGQLDGTPRICLACQAWTIFTLEKETVDVPCVLFFFFCLRTAGVWCQNNLAGRRAKNTELRAYLHATNTWAPLTLLSREGWRRLAEDSSHAMRSRCPSRCWRHRTRQ